MFELFLLKMVFLKNRSLVLNNLAVIFIHIKGKVARYIPVVVYRPLMALAAIHVSCSKVVIMTSGAAKHPWIVHG